MNSLILCEGKTDAILLSYYLEKTCGWTHRNSPKILDIKVNELNTESAYWYRKDDQSLLICGVGGKDNFRKFFKEKIASAIIDSSAFSKIAIVIDCDDRKEQAILDSIRHCLQPVINEISIGAWKRNTYENSYKQDKLIDFLLIVIPPDKEGAMETILLDAIAENEYDKVIVNHCVDFVSGIQPIADRYIQQKRKKLKAILGVTWSIQYPEKIFNFIDSQIRSVKWEKSNLLAHCFKELKKI